MLSCAQMSLICTHQTLDIATKKKKRIYVSSFFSSTFQRLLQLLYNRGKREIQSFWPATSFPGASRDEVVCQQCENWARGAWSPQEGLMGRRKIRKKRRKRRSCFIHFHLFHPATPLSSVYNKRDEAATSYIRYKIDHWQRYITLKIRHSSEQLNPWKVNGYLLLWASFLSKTSNETFFIITIPEHLAGKMVYWSPAKTLN